MADEDKGTSIHPRVTAGKAWDPVSNTCGRPTRARWSRTAEAIEEHLDRHPKDAASHAHLTKVRAKLAGIGG